MLSRQDSTSCRSQGLAILSQGCADDADSKPPSQEPEAGNTPGPGVMTAGTQTSPDSAGETTGKPKRRFKFPTAFTVLFFVLVLIWILTFIIPPGSYSYVSCDGGTPKPVPGTFGAVKVDLSFQERLYDLWVSPRRS